MTLTKKLIAVTALLSAVSAQAQNLDCKNVSTNSDVLICTDGAACEGENGMTPINYEEHIQEFYKASEKSVDRAAIEKSQAEWIARRSKCGEGGSLKNTDFRFKAHECVCKLYEERLTQLRYSKRAESGKRAEELIRYMKMAAKTDIPSTLEARNIYCLTEHQPSAACTLTDKNDKVFFVDTEKSKTLEILLKDLGAGSVFGGLGAQGAGLVRVKCKGGKPATCTWESDQSKGS